MPDSGNSSGNSTRDSSTTNLADPHTHVSNPSTGNPSTNTLANDTPSTSSDNHEPPFYTVIFIKSDGTPTGIPNNAVTLWDNSSSTPTGWNLADSGASRPDMRGKYLKGAATSGDGGSTGGATTHTHTVVSHTHGTNYSHDHGTVTSSQAAQSKTAGTISGANVSVATATHTHTLTVTNQATDAITGNTDTVASDSSEPPFTQQAYIQNNNGVADFPTGVICLWVQTLATIPGSFILCDGTSGTTDLRQQFVKGSSTLGGIGTTGGSLTHGSTHTATGHTHAVASHTHTVTAGTGAAENRTAGSTATATAAHTHPSWSPTGAASFTSGTGTPVPDNFTDTEPPFTSVAFIKYNPPVTLPPGLGPADAMGEDMHMMAHAALLRY